MARFVVDGWLNAVSVIATTPTAVSARAVVGAEAVAVNWDKNIVVPAFKAFTVLFTYSFVVRMPHG